MLPSLNQGSQAFGTVSGRPHRTDHGARVAGGADLAQASWHEKAPGWPGAGEVGWGQAHSRALDSNHAIAWSMVVKDLKVVHREDTEN